MLKDSLALASHLKAFPFSGLIIQHLVLFHSLFHLTYQPNLCCGGFICQDDWAWSSYLVRDLDSCLSQDHRERLGYLILCRREDRDSRPGLVSSLKLLWHHSWLKQQVFTYNNTSHFSCSWTFNTTTSAYKSTKVISSFKLLNLWSWVRYSSLGHPSLELQQQSSLWSLAPRQGPRIGCSDQRLVCSWLLFKPGYLSPKVVVV